MIKIPLHWKEIDQIRKGNAGFIFLEATNKNIVDISNYVHSDGTIDWKKNLKVFAKCIEDEHESEEFDVTEVYFGRKQDDEQNPYKVYIIVKFELC